MDREWDTIRIAYNHLKTVVLSDRFAGNVHSNVRHPIADWHSRVFTTNEIWEAARPLLNAIGKQAKQGNTDFPLYFKSRAFLMDALDSIGISASVLVSEVEESWEIWLKEVEEILQKWSGNISGVSDVSLELALSKLWLILRVSEERYRNRDYTKAIEVTEAIWHPIKIYLVASPALTNLLMLGLTEERLESPLFSSIKNHWLEYRFSSQLLHQSPSQTIWEQLSNIPLAEDLLSLIARIGLTEGKTAIRLSRFARADAALEQCLRSTSAWCELKLMRLSRATCAEECDDNVNKALQTEIGTRFRIALAQSYLAFSSYRRGKFRRAIAHAVPARHTLRHSFWCQSNVFVNMLLAGAERRLAGINNVAHILESIDLCQQVLHYYENVEKDHVAKEVLEGSFKISKTFIPRACYELGVSYYYLSDISELTDSTEDTRRKFINSCLNNAERYADKIISYTTQCKPADSPFWIANSAHLQGLISAKRLTLEGPNPTVVSLKEPVRLLRKAFDSAVAYNQASRWQQIEILADQAIVLNTWARAYSMCAPSGMTESHKEQKQLAEMALERLDHAWAITNEVAQIEAQAQRADHINSNVDIVQHLNPNFCGQVYLYRADSYAILGNAQEAQKWLNKWLQISHEVEYQRVVDLSHVVRNRVNSIAEPFILVPGKNLNFDDLSSKLKEWLFAQATKGNSDIKAIEVLGISRGTFYKWKEEILKRRNTKKNKEKE